MILHERLIVGGDRDGPPPFAAAQTLAVSPLSMPRAPEPIAIGIVDVKLARSPALIYRAFMDMHGRVRIPGRAQPSLPKLVEDCVNVVGGDVNRLTKCPTARVTGE